MPERNTQVMLGAAAVLVGGAIWWTTSRRKAPQAASIVDELAQPNVELLPYMAWVGQGHLGACPHYYAEHVMANTNPEAIQFAEGTISVTALAEAPDHVALPSQLGQEGIRRG